VKRFPQVGNLFVEKMAMQKKNIVSCTLKYAWQNSLMNMNTETSMGIETDKDTDAHTDMDTVMNITSTWT
jgi:hypothetical protein